jgi:hypothetical protein
MFYNTQSKSNQYLCVIYPSNVWLCFRPSFVTGKL